MLDLFAIFTKGGIVLWCFQGTGLTITRAVNSLIKTVILQERGGVGYYEHESLKLQFKLDNEFELVFVVAYQKILQLCYVDKLLQQTQLLYRDKYKNELLQGSTAIQLLLDVTTSSYHDFTEQFQYLLNQLEQQVKLESLQPRAMRQYTKKGDDGKGITPVASVHNNGVEDVDTGEDPNDVDVDTNVDQSERQKPSLSITSKGSARTLGGGVRKVAKGSKKTTSSLSKSPKATNQIKPVKQARQWANEGSSKDKEKYDCSDDVTSGELPVQQASSSHVTKGSMSGQLRPLEQKQGQQQEEEEVKRSTTGGLLSFFKGLTGGKTITSDAMKPVLDKMTDHLIAKNVASDIVDKLCQSVAAKLDGKVIGTFSGVTATVKACFEESLVQILSPQKRIDVLREVLLSKQQKKKPFVITFCGVNGVGKSTNLAKVCFWLLDNGYRVLIAACDTFRSGAVEQLRTHTAHLSALHPPQDSGPPNVQLFERGYNKDAAGIAMEAILYANQQGFDVVLVDTAGRMQNNEPLMTALAKLISVNSPDLVLFVGEALVGNEAVDQLTQFNNALRDYGGGGASATPIDGILLTKFDTIDDKVGAAISMTYTTGQPIMFVGTGQTYTDLKSLNVTSVVTSLMN